MTNRTDTEVTLDSSVGLPIGPQTVNARERRDEAVRGHFRVGVPILTSRLRFSFVNLIRHFNYTGFRRLGVITGTFGLRPRGGNFNDLRRPRIPISFRTQSFTKITGLTRSKRSFSYMKVFQRSPHYESNDPTAHCFKCDNNGPLSPAKS